MTTSEWSTWTIARLQAAYADGQLSAQEYLAHCLRRVEQSGGLNAFISEPPRQPTAVADEGILAGVPVAVKDNICTTDFVTTAASEMLQEYQPVQDATVVARLREAGAVIFGKTNLDEFGMGATTEHSFAGPTLHPLDTHRVAGGSSGGSAVCVAAGICPAALGSDTGGSVRQPASFCGVVGFKPSWGRVSRRGLIAFASSLDQVGWFTRTVDDAAVLFSVLAGADEQDATCVDRAVPDVDPGSVPACEPQQLVVGLPTGWINEVKMQPAVKAGFQQFVRRLEESGVCVREVKLHRIELASAAYRVIATAEASSNLARYDGVRYGKRAAGKDFDQLCRRSRTEGFGQEVKRRIMLGAYVLSEGYVEQYYEQACRVRGAIIEEFRQGFEQVDVMVTPTTPTTAYQRGQKLGPLGAYAGDEFVVPVSLAGLPAMSLPAGVDEDGMPFGVQVTAAAFGERRLFGAARLLEELNSGGETDE